MRIAEGAQSMLALDTCGEQASLALVRDGKIVAESVLEERTASTALLTAVRDLLAHAEVATAELASVGVVNGPGSFTGIRVGLATAKGLGEAWKLPLAMVSRLDVLLQQGPPTVHVSVLRAGRQELYVRQESSTGAVTEQLFSLSAFKRTFPAQILVNCAEDEVTLWLQDDYQCRKIALSAALAVPLLQSALAQGGVDPAGADAHYVRNEQAIYARPQDLPMGAQRP